MTETRRWLCGAVSVPMYGYYWGYTAAQVELLAADCPIVVYPDRKGKKKNGKAEPPKAAAGSVEKAVKEWSGKYGEGASVMVSLEGLRKLK